MDAAASASGRVRVAEPKSRYHCRCSERQENTHGPAAREPIRVLVVDDEEPARQRLVDLLRHDPEVSSILEAKDGLAAVEMINRSGRIWSFSTCRCPDWTASASSTRSAPIDAAHGVRYRLRPACGPRLRGQCARLSVEAVQRRTS